MNNTAQGSARRATMVADDTVAEITATPTRARRGAHAAGFSRRLVALGLVSTLAVGSLFAFAFNSRGSESAGAEADNANLAIPAAAAEAAELGFADRSEAASRDAVRSSVSEAVGEANAAASRTAALGAANKSAQNAETQRSAEEREKLMDEDMELVAKQSEKLKKEAEEAQRRLEAARRAKAAAASSDAGASLSSEDIENLNSTGAMLPLKNARRGAYFGKTGSWSRYHTGQDFPAAVGTPIYAVTSGVVLSPTSGSWAGTNVVIRHSNGGATLYAHMSRRLVSPGETVKAGTLIGYVGETGRTFGPHLHFEYYKPGTTPGDVYSASDPMVFLRSLGVR